MLSKIDKLPELLISYNMKYLNKRNINDTPSFCGGSRSDSDDGDS